MPSSTLQIGKCLKMSLAQNALQLLQEHSEMSQCAQCIFSMYKFFLVPKTQNIFGSPVKILFIQMS